MPRASLSTIVTKYPYQALYLKAVNTYIHTPTERAKKVKYCVQEKFNSVIMYGIDGVIGQQSYWVDLRKFISELKAAGVKYVGIAYSSTNVITFLNSFQDSSSTNQNFDFVISEIEPWVSSSGVSWSSYTNSIKTMKMWASAEIDVVDTWTYQGWVTKPTGTNANDNALNTIKNVNKPCLHNYVYPAPRPDYSLSRFKIYGQQALLAGFTATTKMPILTIFSAEVDFSQTGFKTKSPQAYYDDFVAYMDSQSFAGKECLDYRKGFVVFKDTDLMVARPLKP